VTICNVKISRFNPKIAHGYKLPIKFYQAHVIILLHKCNHIVHLLPFIAFWTHCSEVHDTEHRQPKHADATICFAAHEIEKAVNIQLILYMVEQL
jgi:hypothetical protein